MIFLFEILLCSFPSYLKKSLRRGMWVFGCYLETLSSSWVSNQKYLSPGVAEGLMEQQSSGDQSSELLSLQLGWQTLEHTKCALSSLPSAQAWELGGRCQGELGLPLQGFQGNSWCASTCCRKNLQNNTSGMTHGHRLGQGSFPTQG